LDRLMDRLLERHDELHQCAFGQSARMRGSTDQLGAVHERGGRISCDRGVPGDLLHCDSLRVLFCVCGDLR
jgi:hypothetical protein